ncbi:MAG: hypothetical protein KDK72_10620, partial [Chlamydiia bacterium]|nr:hypothetical protein [Chlamydiia bacterium]
KEESWGCGVISSKIADRARWSRNMSTQKYTESQTKDIKKAVKSALMEFFSTGYDTTQYDTDIEPEEFWRLVFERVGQMNIFSKPALKKMFVDIIKREGNEPSNQP